MPGTVELWIGTPDEEVLIGKPKAEEKSGEKLERESRFGKKLCVVKSSGQGQSNEIKSRLLRGRWRLENIPVGSDRPGMRILHVSSSGGTCCLPARFSR